MDKTALLAAVAAAPIEIVVEGHGPLLFRQVTVSEADQLRGLASKDSTAPSEFGLQLLMRTLVQPNGAPLLDETDLPVLRSSASSKVEALVAAALQANGFGAGGAQGNP